MKSIRRRLTALLAVALLPLVACNGEGSVPAVSSSTTEATVKGKITLGGAPAKGGEVVFDPSNYLRKSEAARAAKIGEGGAYEIKTLVGQNQIHLGGPQISKQMRSATRLSWSLDVQPGDQTFDIKVPAEPTSK